MSESEDWTKKDPEELVQEEQRSVEEVLDEIADKARKNKK